MAKYDGKHVKDTESKGLNLMPLVNRRVQSQPEIFRAGSPAPRLAPPAVMQGDSVGATVVGPQSHPVYNIEDEERIPENIAQASQIVADSVPSNLAEFSRQVAAISQETDVIYDKQLAIYTSHWAELYGILRNHPSDVSQQFLEHVQGKQFFDESLARITDPTRLSNEIESAMELAVFEKVTGLDRLKDNEVADILGKSLSRTILNNITRTFKRDSRNLNHEFSRFVNALHTQGDANAIGLSEELDFEKREILHAFDDSLNSCIKKLEELQPMIVKKMTSVVKTASNRHRSTLPFRLLPELPFIDKSVNVDLNVDDHGAVKVGINVVKDDFVPPAPEPIKQFEDPQVRWAVRLSSWRAGRCAILESLRSNSDPFRNPIAAALAVGLASRQAGWSFNSIGGAGVISTTLSSGIVLLQNFAVGRRLCLSHLQDYDLAAMLHEDGSNPHDVRANLASKFGTRWVSDFETWSRTRTLIPLEKALSVAKEFRQEAGHAALLFSEIEAFETVHNSAVSGERIRYDNEEQEITKKAKEHHVTSLKNTEVIGIRSLTYFEDSTLSKDADELHKLLRANQFFEEKDGVYIRTTKYLTGKYPISMAYFSNPQIAREHPEVAAYLKIRNLGNKIKASRQSVYAYTQGLYASLISPTQLLTRRQPTAQRRTGDIEEGMHQE